MTDLNENTPKKEKELTPSKEFLSALQELEDMEKHPEKYKIFHSVKELMEDLEKEEIQD